MHWHAVALFGALLLVACGDSRVVSGNYYVTDADPSHAYIWKRSADKNRIVVDQQVVDFEVSGEYILVLRKVAESFDCYQHGVRTIVTHYSDNDQYWVIQVRDEKETGPLDKRAYGQLLENLGLPSAHLTVPSNFRENTASFEKWSKDCERLIR